MAELSEVKLTWGEAQHAAQNRAKWKEIVVGLCPTGDEEEWRVNGKQMPQAGLASKIVHPEIEGLFFFTLNW